MANVITGKFGSRRSHCIPDWPIYRAQEADDPGRPDIERPPDMDGPEMNPDEIRGGPGLGAPPFTGEDQEDVGPEPQKHEGANPHVDMFFH
jgi:hypothetical protein